MKGIIGALVVLFFIYSCEEKFEDIETTTDHLYLPLNVGNEWIYQQTSIYYEISGFDTTSVEVREIVTDSTSKADFSVYTLQRSYRDHTDDSWTIDSVYYVKVSDKAMLTQLNNSTKTTLTFPVKEGTTWDINSYNTHSDHLVSYEKVNSEIVTNYDSLFNDEQEGITVMIAGVAQNFVNQNEQYEVYVKGIGMVEKRSIILEFCQMGCDSVSQINTGYYLEKKLKSYVVQ